MKCLEIYELEKNDERGWEEYVYNSNKSTFYHQIGWKNVVEKTYKHKPIYLIAKENEAIRGILPLFLIENIILGRKLVSVPFAPYGGVCADTKLIEKALIEKAKNITNEKGADYFELRNIYKYEELPASNNAYFTLILDLDQGPNIIWEKLRKSMRRYVKKGTENDFKVTKESINLRGFYDVYTKNMRDLGTPIHSYNFFESILHEFPSQANIATVQYKDNIIASLFLLYFKDTVIYGWGSSLKEYLDLNPNYILFWELIKYTYEKKYKFFDFGRSQKSDGTFLFKEGWSAEPKQLHYQYYLNKLNSFPDMSKNNKKRHGFSKIWKKTPILLTKKLGPILRRNIP